MRVFVASPIRGRLYFGEDEGKEDVVRENGGFGGSNVVIFLSRANTT